MKLGDLVHLRSGSPEMTVNFIDGLRVECVWFDEKVIRNQWFALTAVVPRDETELALD